MRQQPAAGGRRQRCSHAGPSSARQQLHAVQDRFFVLPPPPLFPFGRVYSSLYPRPLDLDKGFARGWSFQDGPRRFHLCSRIFSLGIIPGMGCWQGGNYAKREKCYCPWQWCSPSCFASVVPLLRRAFLRDSLAFFISKNFRYLIPVSPSAAEGMYLYFITLWFVQVRIGCKPRIICSVESMVSGRDLAAE